MKVLLHRLAKKYLNRLQPDDRDHFNAAFTALEKEPPEGDITQYEGNSGVLRLKVGNYGALFKFVDNSIFITHIEPRGQAYTKKTRNKRG